MRFWATLLLSLHSLAVLASPLNLQATYVVSAFGADIGESHQQLHCDAQGDCQLTSDTRPIGIARLFTSERLLERSHFRLGTSPRWLRYEKKKYDGDKLVRTVTLLRQPSTIVYVQGPRHFPAHEDVYDPLSLPFVLHHWKEPPQALYLQDNNWQDHLTLTQWRTPEQLDGRATHHYRFQGQHVTVDVWLDAAREILPIKVRVHNHDTDKTITLTLKQEPNTFHAPE